MKTTLKSISKYMHNKTNIDRFLQNKGNNVFYIAFTDELIVCDVSPKEGRHFYLYICLDNSEISLGPVTYVGKL